MARQQKPKEPATTQAVTAQPKSKVLRVTVQTAGDGTCCHNSCSWFEYAGQGIAVCNLFTDQILEDGSRVTAKRCQKCLDLYA